MPEDILVKGHRRGFLVPALINVAIAAYNGWNWSQGHISGATKALTIFPLCLLALKGVLLLKPPFMQLSGGRFRFRLGMLADFTTPAGNVEGLDLVDGKVRLRFRELSKIDGSKNLRDMLNLRYGNTGHHIEFPLGKETDAYRSLRKALVPIPGSSC